MAIRRILLIYGVVMTAGGIPLIYLGDEIGTLNDYSYRDHPLHAQDSRWVHRPQADWEGYSRRRDHKTIEGRIYQGFRKLIRMRKQHEFLAGGKLEVFSTENDHVLGFIRTYADQRAIILANFSEKHQTVPVHILEQYSISGKQRLHGISRLSDREDFTLAPYDLTVFARSTTT